MCVSCYSSPYTLPTIEFVGGSQQNLSFRVYWHTTTKPFDLTRCSADFSVVGFTNRRGSVILSKTMRIDTTGSEENGSLIYNKLCVTLESSETVSLEGKYIYQISIKENTGKVEVPSQGVLYISNNINKQYVSG